MVYQGATGLYHFLINVIPFISNSVLGIYMNSRDMLITSLIFYNTIEIMYIMFRMLYFLIIYVMFYIDTFVYS